MIFFVVPCFNEEKRFIEDYWNELLLIPNTKWLFVNDGSTDQTTTVLENLSLNENVNNLTLKKNVGKAEAIRLGFLHHLNSENTEPIILGQIDFDSSYKANDINRIIDIARDKINNERFDAVWGARIALAGREVLRKSYRHYISRILITMVGFFVKNLPYDTQTSLKLFKFDSELIHTLKSPFKTRWFFDVELYLRLKSLKGDFKLWEEPVAFTRDVDNSKIRGYELYRVLRDLIRLFYIVLIK
jgi:dolichyl-phosphate beta-glucosyltransferase